MVTISASSSGGKSAFQRRSPVLPTFQTQFHPSLFSLSYELPQIKMASSPDRASETGVEAMSLFSSAFWARAGNVSSEHYSAMGTILGIFIVSLLTDRMIPGALMRRRKGHCRFFHLRSRREVDLCDDTIFKCNGLRLLAWLLLCRGRQPGHMHCYGVFARWNSLY